MRGWVLVGGARGGFVTPGGWPKSYTMKLQEARVWTSASAAAREACGNEQVVRVEDCLPREGQ